MQKAHARVLEVRGVVAVVVVDLHCLRWRDWSFATAEVDGDG